ncbi:MAG TPA: hypothetical protein VLK36_03785 [Gaiellaceae bacterium]|nr:hypothetical protein [Gaiellaceae bacterium]
MSDFVEQCRREWRRLGVPDPLADEMAADLASDLAEAEGEGVSAEELLGRSAFDPSSFAATWAAERGIVPAPQRRGIARKPVVLVVFTALAATTVIVAALLLLSGRPTVTMVASGNPKARLFPPTATFVPPAPDQHVLQANTSAPVEWILLFLAVAALGFAAWLWAGWSSSRRYAPL